MLNWLASYPKSGNTWVRILLTNYLSDSDEPAPINELETGQIASARNVFDDNVGVEASDLTQDEIERYRPDAFEHYARQLSEPQFIKVHDAYTYTSDGVPLMCKPATAGALYIVRNPMDVCVSMSHHSASTIEHTIALMGSPNGMFVGNPHQLSTQLRQRLLSWSQHVSSWADEPGLRVKVIRYEDLLADTESEFTDIVRFFNLDIDQKRIARAVDFSRFDRLQAQEDEIGFDERPGKAKRFFRKGKAGSWRDELSTEHVQQIVSDHGQIMRRFNYSTDVCAT